MLYQILNLITPIIVTPYITRLLGSENLGIHSYYFSVASYFSIFILLGLNNYGTRVIASCQNDKNERSKNFINIYSFQLFCGILVSAVYILFILFVSNCRMISTIFLIYIAGTALDINWLYFGLEQFKTTAVRSITLKLLSVISVFVFVRTENDLYIYSLIISATYLLSQLWLWFSISKKIHFVRPSFAEIKRHIKPNFILFITVILISLYKIMDKIMLGIMTNYSEVAYYEASEKIIAVPLALITTLGTVMLPRSTNLTANKNESKVKKYILISIVFAMFVSTSMCFGIMGISGEFVPLFYGAGYEKSVPIYLALLPSCVFLAFANVIRTQYLLPNKMDRPYIISAAIGASVNIISNLLLIPYFQSVGAAIGTLLAEAAVCIYQSYSVRKNLEVAKYIKLSIPFVFAGLTMFAGLFYINIHTGNEVWNILIKIVIGIVLYMVIMIVYSLLYKLFTKKNWLPDEIKKIQ